MEHVMICDVENLTLIGHHILNFGKVRVKITVFIDKHLS